MIIGANTSAGDAGYAEENQCRYRTDPRRGATDLYRGRIDPAELIARASVVAKQAG